MIEIGRRGHVAAAFLDTEQDAIWDLIYPLDRLEYEKTVPRAERLRLATPADVDAFCVRSLKRAGQSGPRTISVSRRRVPSEVGTAVGTASGPLASRHRVNWKTSTSPRSACWVRRSASRGVVEMPKSGKARAAVAMGAVAEKDPRRRCLPVPAV
jgi:hypothetical protein